MTFDKLAFDFAAIDPTQAACARVRRQLDAGAGEVASALDAGIREFVWTFELGRKPDRAFGLAAIDPMQAACARVRRQLESGIAASALDGGVGAIAAALAHTCKVDPVSGSYFIRAFGLGFAAGTPDSFVKDRHPNLREQPPLPLGGAV